MRRIAKILSVIMVVALMFSMAVIPTSAASEAGFSYTFKDSDGTNVITKASKGDMVRLYINLNTGDNKVSAFQNTFIYDASVFTVYRSATQQLTTTGTATAAVKYAGNFADSTEYDIYSNDDYMNEDTLGEDYYYNCSKYANRAYNYLASEPSSWSDAKKEQYNVFKIVHGLSTSANVLFIETNGEYEEFGYIFLKVNEDTELTSAVVGIDDSIDADLNYMETPDDQSYYFTASALNNGCNFETFNVAGSTTTLEIATPVAAPTVEAKGTMARMDDWTKAESTNTFDGGLIGQINNVNLTFTDNECNEIESIEVWANGQKMGNAYQVYKVDDTTYQFRAVVKNMDKTAETYATDVEYEFKVTMKGDYASYGTLTATKTVSAQTIFTDAYANYKAANA